MASNFIISNPNQPLNPGQPVNPNQPFNSNQPFASTHSFNPTQPFNPGQPINLPSNLLQRPDANILTLWQITLRNWVIFYDDETGESIAVRRPS